MPRTRRAAVIGFVVTWAVLTGVGIVIFNLIGFPPDSNVSDIASSESQIIKLLTELAWPVFVGVLCVLGFALYVNRFAPAGREPSPQQLRGHRTVQVAWVGVTTCVVLGLAVAGTVTLANDTHPAAAASNESAPLEVQVIAQQWQFTYRYPASDGLGGDFESAQLVLPAGREIDFHVTSLDVVHSFWFYAAGLKLDAVPGVDNTGDLQPLQIGTYRITCAELCGIWHAGMAQDNAQIVSDQDFTTWVQQQQQLSAPVMQYLPPYSHVYNPNDPKCDCAQPPAYGT